MKSVRSRITIVAVGTVVAIVNWTAHAQSPQTGSASTPPMDHMMMHGHAMQPDHQHMHGMAAQSGQPPMSKKSDDPRELVSLPGPMQEHMLANMRDHDPSYDAPVPNYQPRYDNSRPLLPFPLFFGVRR